MSAAVVRLRPDLNGRRQPPGRRPNADLRAREYLTEAEVLQLVTAARKRGRYGQRDALAILLCYRHGLRVSELVGLAWAQIDLAAGRIHVRRLKGSDDGTHVLQGDELRLLRQARRDQPDARFVLMTERGAPMTRAGFARMLERTAKAAGLAHLKPHPHVLRHAAGYKVINDGHSLRVAQQFLGHWSVNSTARYTALAPGALAEIKWRSS